MFFDEGDDFVDALADGFEVAVFGDADGGIVEVVFVDDGEGGGNGSEEGELGAFNGGGGVAEEALGEASGAGEATEFGEIADDEFFGGREFGDLAVLSGNAEADEDGFFELTDAFASDVEIATDLFEGFLGTVEPKATRDNFAFALLLDDA